MFQNNRYQENLHNSEEKYRTIVENLNEVIYTLDEKARITYVSPNIHWLAGFHPCEVIGRSFIDLVHPEDRAERMEKFRSILTGSNEATEYRFITKDGRVVWARTAARPVFRDGRAAGVQGVLTDITDRKQAEMALQEALARMNSLMENSPNPITIFDKEGRYIEVSAAAAKVLGYSPEEVKGKTFQELLPPEVASDFMQTIVEMQKGKKAMKKIDVINMNGSGGEKILETWLFPIEQKESKIELFGAIAVDITERKKAEKSLNYQLQFEKMVSEISSYFVSLPSEQLDQGIHFALKLTGEFFQVDRSYVFQFSNDGQNMNNTHEWCAKGIQLLLNKMQDFSVNTLPWWLEQIKTKEYLYIYDVNKLPPEAKAEKKVFKSQDIQSLLCIPMITNGSLFGFLGFDAVKKKKNWVKEHIMFLKVVAELITNVFVRYLAEEKIRHLSFHDGLTQLYNRRYMEEEMKRLDTKRQQPISIIMCDLNGLKLVNDTYGHSAGDEMLKCAAEIMRESCRGEDIIARWGGDEFVILLPGTTKIEAWAICKRIHEKCSRTYVQEVPISMASGAASKNSIEKDLKETLKEAEDEMYKKKLTESRSEKSMVLNALLKTLEEKSFETETHTRRMQDIALKIGERIGLPDSELSRLRLLITLHDIGKINIPEEILTKKGPLTAEEWTIIEKHPETGYRIARATEGFAHVTEGILSHHEHWDGSGYPRGLSGKRIPLLARITSIADAYEVMSNGRPYKEPLSQNEVIAEFKRCAGKQFDPELVKVFLSILEEGML